MGNYRKDHLSEIQEEILAYIRRHIAVTGEAPTLREIAGEVGRSLGGVHYQLGEPEGRSLIARDGGRARGIRLT